MKKRRFVSGTEVVGKTAPEFVRAENGERDERHKRMGDSRYVVEPNVKDGKGGCAICTRSTGSANISTA